MDQESMNPSLYRPIQLGSLHVEGNLFAAPMAGYTDHVAREVALNHGANLAYTEMISAEALTRGSERTQRMMRRGKNEEILAVQLFGSNPERLGQAAQLAVQAGANLLDLNAGCPVPKVTRNGAGSALPRDPVRLKEILLAMAEAKVPVSVKIRRGWNELEGDYWETALQMAVEAKAVAVGFHPRSRQQGYGGKADWELLTKVVQESPLPILGSGDLRSPQDVHSMLSRTGCAGVMLARGAVGKPQLYSQCRHFLQTGESTAPLAPVEKLIMAKNHLESAIEAFGADRASRDMKKQLAGYTSGWNGSNVLRHELMQCPHAEDLLGLLDSAITKGSSSI